MAKRITKTKATNKRRKGLMSVVMPWLKRFGFIMAALIFAAWLAAWIILSGAGVRAMEWSKQQVISASAKAGFTVQNLLVEGRVNADAQFMLALLNVQMGDPLFGISPEAAKNLLEDTEWVRRARVERRLPSTLYIQLKERIPTAIMQDGDQTYLVDEYGKQIKTDRLERFKNLIVISGNNAPQEVTPLINHLRAEKKVAARVSAAKRISNRRWDIILDNGLVLNLPEDKDIGYAIKRAAEAQSEGGLFDMDSLESVDLRYEDKMILKTKPGGAQNYKKMTKESNT